MSRLLRQHVLRILVALICVVSLALSLIWLTSRHPAVARPCESSTNVAAAESDVGLSFRGFADGPPPAQFDTGQKASLVNSVGDPGAAFVLRSGRLTYAPTQPGVAAAYLSTPDLGAPVTGIGARWSLTSRGGRSGAMVLVVSHATRSAMPALVAPVPVHLAVEAHGWNLSLKQDSRDALTSIASGPFDPTLKQDGRTQYNTSMQISGSRVTINLPDGTTKTVEDPRIGDFRGNCATFEAFANDGSTDSIPAFEYVWATTK